jgi:hypothetical protein
MEPRQVTEIQITYTREKNHHMIIKSRDCLKKRIGRADECIGVVFQVDISTMLEEAVQYVKFMQLQIKVGSRKIIPVAAR